MNTTNQTIETVQTDTSRAEASAFIARLVEQGKSMNDLTPDECAEAQRLGFTLIPQTWGRGKPLPANPTMNDFRRCW